MAGQTAIEWTDSSFNPWVGCTKVSPACDNCYASVATPTRALGVVWGHGQARRRTSPGNWKLPRRWNDRGYFECLCGRRGEAGDFKDHPGCQLRPVRRRVFCASLADVFDNEVPDQWRRDLFDLIRQTPNLDWLLLTKRIGNARAMLNAAVAPAGDAGVGAGSWERDPWPNVWLGATICNQAEADRDIPKLLEMPAAVRFLSLEPLLGPVDLTAVQWPGKHRVDVLRGGAWNVPGWLAGFTNHSDMARIDWIIAGGESGPSARPLHPDWIRSLRDECREAEVPFLFKQWGEWRPINQPDALLSPDDGGDRWHERLYRSRRRAGEGESQAELDDIYGKTCTVPKLCLHDDGRHRDLNELGSYAMDKAPVLAFRVGKKKAGRLLDGAEHRAFPSGQMMMEATR